MNTFKNFKVNNTEYQLDWENGIGNKPFGNEQIKEEYIPLQDISFSLAVNEEGTPQYWEEVFYPLTSSPNIEVGDVVDVVWDNISYQCTVFLIQGTIPAIGNTVGFDGQDNGMPFVIAFDKTGMLSGTIGMLLMNGDEFPTDASVTTITHSISVSITKEILTQINPKYIKDMYGSEGYSYTTLLEETSYDFTYDEADQWYVTQLPSLGLVVNKTYRVTIDGVPLISTYKSMGNGAENLLIVGSYFISEFEEDAIAVAFQDVKPRSHTIAVEEQGEEIIHQIPSKYIKDMYGTEEGALLFKQYVTTVAENGGFNLNRDLGDLGLEPGKTYKVIFDGVEYTCTAQGNEQIVMLGDPLLVDNGEGITSTGEPFGYVAYLSMSGYGFGTKEAGTFHVEIYEDEVIHQIPSKYIKDMYGTEKSEIIEILPYNEITCSDMGNGLYGLYVPQKLFDLQVGKTYLVNWDGINYECIAVSGVFDGQNAIGVGNLSIVDMGEDTGEPFVFGVPVEFEASICYTKDSSPSHTGSLSLKNEVIKQIDPKYVNGYTKEEIDAMFGSYVDEVNTLLGGE